MMAYLLMLVSIAFASANSCVLHAFGNRGIRGLGDTFYFNGGIASCWIVLLGLLSLVSGDFAISTGSIMYGCVYGVIICAFLLFKNLALTSGPVSLTMLIGSCPFILTTVFGVAFMKQSVSTLKLVGTAMIIVALVLCLKQDKSGEKKELSLLWLIYSVAFFLAGGGVGIIYMLFGVSDSATEINAMMLCAAATATLLYFGVGSLIGAKNRERPAIHRSGLPFIIACGVASCVYMRMNLWLSTVIPAVIFFPVSNGSLVLITTATSRLLFGERLTKRQLVGMAVGIVAIVTVGLG